MDKVKTGCWLLVLAGLIFAVTGCNESQVQKKQAMKAKWEADTAQAKVPLMNDMIARGDIQQAKKMLQQCLQDNPANPHYHILMGRIHFIEENRVQARECFQAAVDLDKQLPEGWFYLGVLAVLDKTYDLAIEYYKIACALDPENTEYAISMADVLMENGQSDQAAQRLESNLERHSQDLDLILALAQIKHQSGQTVQAVQIYEQALLLHGDEARILEPCAYGYIALGKWDLASRAFEKLLPHHKNDKVRYYSTLRSVAMCSMNCGRYDRAMACYDELSVPFREDADIWLSMAQCALGADDAEQAVYYAQKALKYEPMLPKAYAVMGSSYYLKADYNRSLDTFNRITADDQLGGFSWFMVGRCYQQLGYAEQADAAYKRAHEFDPESELMKVFLKKTVQSL